MEQLIEIENKNTHCTDINNVRKKILLYLGINEKKNILYELLLPTKGRLRKQLTVFLSLINSKYFNNYNTHSKYSSRTNSSRNIILRFR